ncbi:complement factor H-related protein 4-like [Thunnus maccoyii]|uniref:complement factor H-related protein 4-like n=1 Tax=Thunnus maccoyii TaxID=8240 RepID=UPI001C4D87CC|nr:complement factor H-related protein 4-like [Thunnus maccoyii]
MRFFHLLWLFILWLNMDKSLQQNEVTCPNQKHQDVYDWNVDWWQRITLDDTASYRCRSGYKKTDGADKLTCTRDGWSPDPPCQELLGCGTPPFLANGDIKYTIKSQYSHNERVEYMCQSHYTMEGEPHKTCINGEWTGQMRCLKPCILNEDDTRQHNITLKSSDNKYFHHDEIIEFRCARGVPVGEVALSQRCNGGVVLLPTCQ